MWVPKFKRLHKFHRKCIVLLLCWSREEKLSWQMSSLSKARYLFSRIYLFFNIILCSILNFFLLRAVNEIGLYKIVGCNANEHTCENRRCIDSSKKCDGFYDCADATDEIDCRKFDTYSLVGILVHYFFKSRIIISLNF